MFTYSLYCNYILFHCLSSINFSWFRFANRNFLLFKYYLQPSIILLLKLKELSIGKFFYLHLNPSNKHCCASFPCLRYSTFACRTRILFMHGIFKPSQYPPRTHNSSIYLSLSMVPITHCPRGAPCLTCISASHRNESNVFESIMNQNLMTP